VDENVRELWYAIDRLIEHQRDINQRMDLVEKRMIEFLAQDAKKATARSNEEAMSIALDLFHLGLGRKSSHER
jgi:hypothetical protein